MKLTSLPITIGAPELCEYVLLMRERIDRALPPGAVIPAHTKEGHFYRVPSGNTYPSVTGKLAVVKDESIQNWNMNEALRFVMEHASELVNANGTLNYQRTMTLFDEAKTVPKEMLYQAGKIGTKVHDRREQYFQAWIDSGQVISRPSIRSWMKDDDDPRLTAGMLALDDFLTKTSYIPIRTEVMVYSDRYKVSGTLDDIGLMKHNNRWKLTLLDLKTSNQMKAHYWLQVAMYHLMFVELVGVRPELNLILKVSKDMPTYKTEEIKDIRRVVAGARRVLAVSETMDFIKATRKDLGKKIITLP